jgi:hypothetical protein
MGYALRDHRHYTYADYRMWPEDVRCELVDGAGAIGRSSDIGVRGWPAVRQCAGRASCRVLMAPVDVLLSQADQADQAEDVVDTVVQPDVLVVCDPHKITPRGIRGAPDWVLEVISPASASHDQIIKLAAYERVGVREYWLAHPADQVLAIYRLDGSTYGRPQIVELTGEAPVGVLAGVTIRWEPVVTRLLTP